MDKITIKELKSNAKEQLLGQYGILGGATVVISLFMIALSMVISVVTPEGDAGRAVSAIGQLVIIFVEAIFLYGFSGMIIRTICNMPSLMSDLFDGFKDGHLIPVIHCELKLFLYTFFCFLPAGTALGLAFIFKDNMISAIAVGVAIVGIFVYVYVSLIYSFRYFCMLDFPGRRGKDYMRLSKEIIKGNEMKLLLIKLSFIPWDILILLSLGIASIWIKPYKRATEGNFYLYLMSRR